jgi:lysophospholipase L1-like esterase
MASLLIDRINLFKIGPVEATIYSLALVCFISGFILAVFQSSHLIIRANKASHLFRMLSILGWVFFSILSLFNLLEIGAEAYLRYNQINQLYWYTINRRTGAYNIILESPAYQNLPYATPEFIDEVIASQAHTNATFEQLGFILPNDFHGEWINIVDHRRITIAQPQYSQSVIYLFGGSTIFNLAVPDEYTVASLLQEKLNASYGNTYRVENMGVIGATTNQQTLRLQSMNLNEGDVVIFLDGYNDIFKAIHRDHEPILNLLSKSIFFHFFLRPSISQWMPKFSLPNSDAMKSEYYQNIHSAWIYTKSENAYFLHFVQPSLHTVSDRSQYEDLIVQNLIVKGRGWHESMVEGIPQIVSTHEQLVSAGVPSWDATFILDHDQHCSDHEIFLDDIHVNHLGNEIIARKIFETLIEIIPTEESHN